MSQKIPGGVWNGDDFERVLMDTMGKRLTRAAMEWTRHAKRALSKAATSSPGDYPGKETGHLRRNIAGEVDTIRLRGRVGTNVLYGKFLELGTKTMDKRPWMKLTNKKMRKRITDLLGKKL